MCKYEDSVQASCGSYTLTGIDSQVRQERFLNSMQFDDFNLFEIYESLYSFMINFLGC